MQPSAPLQILDLLPTNPALPGFFFFFFQQGGGKRKIFWDTLPFGGCHRLCMELIYGRAGAEPEPCGLCGAAAPGSDPGNHLSPR